MNASSNRRSRDARTWQVGYIAFAAGVPFLPMEHQKLHLPSKEPTNVTTETRRTLPKPSDPVREPIINSPFETPQWRWQLDASTKAYAPALPGRRDSQNIPPVAGSRKLRGTQAMPGEMGAHWIPLKLVNDIRTTVLNWQEEGCPGITQTSRDLISHWTDEEACQLYFAQLDAMLIHIYLNEAATNQIREEIQGINDQYNDGILRIAHKMATATGKTPVMAMLILYHTANHRNAAPDDHRFTRRFLVITPGLTGPRTRRQRLEGLQPRPTRRPVGAGPGLCQCQRDQLPPDAAQGHGADQHQAATANCGRLKPDNP